MRHGPESNVLLSDGKPFLYLLPLLSLGWGAGKKNLPPVFVNSIPKSGTYFLEAAFARLGAVPLRLHFGSSSCHDYRGVPENEMHRQPDDHFLPVPAGAIAALMRPGDVAVGHVEDHVQLDAISEAGVRVLHAVPVGTLRDWEQARSTAPNFALAYMRVIALHPDVIAQAVAQERV